MFWAVLAAIGAFNAVVVAVKLNRTFVCPQCGEVTKTWRLRAYYPENSPFSRRANPFVRCLHCKKVIDLREAPSPSRPPPRLLAAHGPQVVGAPCAVCKDRIILDTEAAPCAICGRPVHLACLPHAHDEDASPYRG